ncbi:MAG: hypothetical protein COC04_02125 [Gammaproteobacteria bacterium]|nr:DUF4304 domain-containing protein [Colwellia sp.]PCH65348.1 MAG: hypothetical protein COC04_02125 [Gammaproteobacteria bacterium]
MSKMRELFRCAKDEFIPSLKSDGFVRYGRKNIFIRRHDDYYQLISFLSSRWGDKFYVTVDIWIPELCKEEVISKVIFDKTICSFNIGGNLSGCSVRGGGTYQYKDEETETRALLKDILGGIRVYAFPWFALMSDRKYPVATFLSKNYNKSHMDLVSNERNLEGIQYLIPNSINIIELPKVQPLVNCRSTNLLEGDRQLIEEKLIHFIEFVKSRGFEYISEPQFYLVRKVEEVYHFVEFEFENDGLFIEVALSIFVGGEPNSYPAHDKNMKLCDIDKEWPVTIFTPLRYYLTDGRKVRTFPVYSFETIEKTNSALENAFTSIYDANIAGIDNKSEFRKLVREKRNAG